MSWTIYSRIILSQMAVSGLFTYDLHSIRYSSILNIGHSVMLLYPICLLSNLLFSTFIVLLSFLQNNFDSIFWGEDSASQILLLDFTITMNVLTWMMEDQCYFMSGHVRQFLWQCVISIHIN